jgi:hypothetical protein
MLRSGAWFQALGNILDQLEIKIHPGSSRRPAFYRADRGISHTTDLCLRRSLAPPEEWPYSVWPTDDKLKMADLFMQFNTQDPCSSRLIRGLDVFHLRRPPFQILARIQLALRSKTQRREVDLVRVFGM